VNKWYKLLYTLLVYTVIKNDDATDALSMTMTCYEIAGVMPALINNATDIEIL